MGLEEELSKFRHEVEEEFADVREHMILSVERHSFLIAFVLMIITAIVLTIGTIYVWCFHRGRSPARTEEPARNSTTGDTQVNSGSRDAQVNSGSGDAQVKKDTKSKLVAPTSYQTPDQNGKVRKRIPSSSGTVNNNESPVKSKIPVLNRSRSKSKSTS